MKFKTYTNKITSRQKINTVRLCTTEIFVNYKIIVSSSSLFHIVSWPLSVNTSFHEVETVEETAVSNLRWNPWNISVTLFFQILWIPSSIICFDFGRAGSSWAKKTHLRKKFENVLL